MKPKGQKGSRRRQGYGNGGENGEQVVRRHGRTGTHPHHMKGKTGSKSKSETPGKGDLAPPTPRMAERKSRRICNI
eukprot:2105810-Prorocentrum_lima.AAC.1